jgi:hypothetical protein
MGDDTMDTTAYLSGEEDEEDEDDEEDEGADIEEQLKQLERMFARSNSAPPSTTLIYEHHPTIQISSTSFHKNFHTKLRSRYMIWNNVGNITLQKCVGDGNLGDCGRIEIRFSNNGANRNILFKDSYDDGYIMAGLAFEGAIFATAERSKNIGSTIHYHAFPGAKQLEGANEVS